MLRLKEGEDIAFNELTGRWPKPLVSVILRDTGHEQDAPHLAQENTRFLK
jgi:hypothetical protein